MSVWTWAPLHTSTAAAPPPVTHGGLHHIAEGMGDVGDGPRVPQTLHTIERGISTARLQDLHELDMAA